LLVARAGYAEYYTAPETHWIDLKWARFVKFRLKTRVRFAALDDFRNWLIREAAWTVRLHPLIRSCWSPFAIQLKLLPQLRDDAASRVDVLGPTAFEQSE
jgi:hypothetical protein